MPVTHGVTGSSPVRTAIKITQYQSFGSVAQLNRASDYGSEGYRFESCRSHKGSRKLLCEILFLSLFFTGFFSFIELRLVIARSNCVESVS